MNDIFNFRRFGKYFTSDAKSCSANYGLSMLLISFMGLIIYAGTILMGLIFKGQWGGPQLGFRVVTFAVSMICLTFSMPVKCYGRITEKRFGSQWIMIPASGFEKTLSMILMNVIVMPLVMCIVYLGVDAILCGIDSTCGASIAGSFKYLLDSYIELSLAGQYDLSQYPAIVNFFKQVSCPWLYVDDIMGFFLITLLGSILFTKGKTSKTILSYIAVTAALGIMVTPLANIIFKEFATLNINADAPEAMNQLFSMGVFRHAALIDTINDTLVNLGLITAIYFRVKTIKH